MALFGKRKGPPDLGRGMSDAEGNVIEMPRDEDAARSASDMVVESSDVIDEVVGKPSRAEKRAAAKAAKAAKAASGSTSPGKLTRAQRKAQREAAEAASDALRPSNKVMIDFFPGIAKEDAIETARNWALTHMDMPSMCFYYVHRIQDGWAVEVQEGVGKAYLPSVLRLAQESPGRLVIVPMIRRKMTVYYSARLGEFEAQILPEFQEPPVMAENPPVEAKRGPAMTPVMKQYREWLVAGAVTAAIGGLALLSSLTFYALDPKAKVPPEWRTTDVALLPIMQWSRLQANSTDSYVVRLEFQDGQWRIVRQAVGASVDLAKPDSTDSSGQIVGGQVPNPDGSPVDVNRLPTQPAPGQPGVQPTPVAPAPNGPAVSIPPPSN